jgi:hypothetical protein
MISPNKVVFEKFKIMLIKMAQDASIHETIVWGLSKYV